MINLTNIHFGYSKKRMLFSELSLNLTPGHIYGLLGKNGAGKTTLLKIISGLLFSQNGTANVMGKRAELRDPENLKEIYFLPKRCMFLISKSEIMRESIPHFIHLLVWSSLKNIWMNLKSMIKSSMPTNFLTDNRKNC
jgi:ABC-2 type transport system ATP-binding protein